LPTPRRARSETAATLQESLALIDRAIEESRTAVAAQPGSEQARLSLLDNFQQKMSLLQRAVTLIGQMRAQDPGDVPPAGAARDNGAV
jgi:hypothetical protein